MRSNPRNNTPKLERTKHPGVYKRGGRYVVVTKHRGKQRKEFFRTQAEALEAQGRHRAGEWSQNTRARFEQYAVEWLDHYRGRTESGLADSTRAGYRLAIEQHAVPFFGRCKLAEIEPPDVRRYVAHLERKGLAPSSIRKTLAPLKVMFATAVEDGMLRSNPAATMRVGGQRRAQEEQVRALTRAQLATLLAELPAEWRLFFELLAHTGLRVSEAIGLTWADVRFGTPTRLRVRRQVYRGKMQPLKTAKSRREVPLSRGLAQRLWTQRGRANEPMFATATGTSLDDHNLRRRVLKPAAARAGVSWAGFHAFRHTAASLLFEGGKDITQVSEWLGHSDAAFTLRTYVHLLERGLGDADFLDGLVLVGNPWATQHPETAANPGAGKAPETASTSEISDQPITAANAGASS